MKPIGVKKTKTNKGEKEGEILLNNKLFDIHDTMTYPIPCNARISNQILLNNKKLVDTII
jgi:hypothetical protein